MIVVLANYSPAVPSSPRLRLGKRGYKVLGEKVTQYLSFVS